MSGRVLRCGAGGVEFSGFGDDAQRQWELDHPDGISADELESMDRYAAEACREEGHGEAVTPREHVWSGWPGAFCRICFAEDIAEICATEHDHAELDPARGVCVVPCQNEPCPGPRAVRKDDPQ